MQVNACKFKRKWANTFGMFVLFEADYTILGSSYKEIKERPRCLILVI